MRLALATLAALLAAATLAAGSAQAAQQLSVAVSGTGSGTVTSIPAGIECGSSCEATFADGALVKLRAGPDGGSEAGVWELCPGTVNGAGECELTLDAAKQARVSFALAWHSEQPIGPGGRTYLGPVGDVKCYAANRCLLISGGNASMPAGIYAYDGSDWYLYSTVCGGAEGSIAWVGPSEFWTVSDPQAGQQSTTGPATANSLCHFKDGVVLASYAEPTGLLSSYGKMRAAACLAPDECWFGGEKLPLGATNVGAFHLYWNGISLNPVPSLTQPEPDLEFPNREVVSLAYHQGGLYEGVLAGADDEAPGEEPDQPSFLHRVLPGAPAGIVPLAPAAPIEYGAGATPQQLEGFRLSDDGEGLWAVSGAVENTPAEVTVLRLTGSGLAQLQLTGPGGFQPGEPVAGLGAEPGAGAAWVGYRLSGEGPEALNLAHLARIGADGAVEPRIDLPAEGEGIGARGPAGPIACAAGEQCWMATKRGWLFHLGPDPAPNQDPAMHTLITSRPADNSLPTVPPTSLPEDDSGEVLTKNEEPLAEAEPEPLPRRRPALYGKLRQQLIHGRVLELSFLLRVRAHVRLRAMRRGKVVAKTKRYTMAKGRRRVRIRLDPKRWPTKLDLEVKEIKTTRKGSK